MLYGAVSFFLSSVCWVPHVPSARSDRISKPFNILSFFFLGGEEGRLVVCHHNLIDFAEQQQQQQQRQRIILAYVCVMCICCVCVPKSACWSLHSFIWRTAIECPAGSANWEGACVCVCVLSDANPLTFVTDQVSNHSPRVHRCWWGSSSSSRSTRNTTQTVVVLSVSSYRVLA